MAIRHSIQHSSEEGPWNPNPILLEDLVRTLKEDHDPTKRGILICGKDYNANELIEEVKKGTEIGRWAYDNHLRSLDDLGKNLISYLENSREDNDAKIFSYGASIYSTNELIQQIKDKTLDGVEHIRMYIDETRRQARDQKSP
ncbi:MAG TPA: hypothetical protein VJH92_05245 [Candidatus Nanoarchaeia archaeon]|nr:hypothetical protein [Candidatus Nanoarchaeia archaeon]